MLSNAELVCFAATCNAPAAKDFYQGVLGLALVDDSPFALAFDATGTMLRIQKVQEHVPAKHTSLGWRVADIRSHIDALVRKGIRFERYDGLPQDEAGVWESPAGVRVAWFRDPDGNTLSLTQWPGRS
jgi:catechol 2,3-dioxygenase-like lactoylglutathione lyase family enzyme